MAQQLGEVEPGRRGYSPRPRTERSDFDEFENVSPLSCPSDEFHTRSTDLADFSPLESTSVLLSAPDNHHSDAPHPFSSASSRMSPSPNDDLQNGQDSEIPMRSFTESRHRSGQTWDFNYEPVPPPEYPSLHPTSYDAGRQGPGKVATFRGQFSVEQPKVICRNSLSSVLWRFCLLHLPSIAFTLTLLGLYIKGFQWTPPHPTSEELSALIFAAKAHEIFIMISITDILLHRIHYTLLEQNGIPLGFLSSGFYLSSPVQYLLSWEFWGTALNPVSNSLSHKLTAGGIVLLTLISLGASPLSAILIIPRTGLWIPSDNSFENTTWVNRYTSNYLFQNEMDLNMWVSFGDDCLSVGEDDDGCYEVTLGPLLAYLDEPISEPPVFSSWENSSITRQGKPLNFRHISWATIPSDDLPTEIAVATGPMKFTSDALKDDTNLAQSSISNMTRAREFIISSQHLDSNGGSPKLWQQPFTAVYCERVEKPNTTVFHFNNTLRGQFTVALDYNETMGSLNFTGIEPDQYYVPDGDFLGRVNPLILDIQSQISHPISTAILFPWTQQPPIVRSNKTFDTTIANTSDTRMMFNLCLCEARWAYADTWMTQEPSLGSIFDLSIPKKSPFNYLKDVWQRQPIIKMKRDWLEGLDTFTSPPDLNASESKSLINKAYLEMAAFCDTGFQPDNAAHRCLPIPLSLYLTDALSSFAGSDHGTASEGWIRQRLSVEDAIEYTGPNQTLAVATIRWSGYAYSLKGLSIIGSFAVLLLHVIIVLLHNGFIMFSADRWTSSAWGRFGSLMTLALRSKPVDGLDNAGAGVTSAGTWRTVLRVREVGEKGHLEILDAPSRDEHFTREANDISREGSRIRRVKPGAKYS